MKRENIYNIYIDEAGDEGFKFNKHPKCGSSRFFVISALIVSEKDDLSLSKLVNELKKMFNYQPKDMLIPLHFVRMSHDKRKACVKILKDFQNFTIISVVFDKKSLNNEFKNTPYLYNFSSQILLERINSFLKLNSAKANLIFEHRRNTSYIDLQNYLKKIIDTSLFLSLSSKTKEQLKCLQLADIVASATYQAFEPDYYGNLEVSYIYSLKDNFFRYNEKSFGYGLKFYPSNSKVLSSEDYNWINSVFIK